MPRVSTKILAAEPLILKEADSVRSEYADQDGLPMHPSQARQAPGRRAVEWRMPVDRVPAPAL